MFSRNQDNSQLDRWEGIHTNNSKVLQNETIVNGVREYKIMYNITSYEEYWEPPLILPANAPGFEERFIGYGFTRNSQVIEIAKFISDFIPLIKSTQYQFFTLLLCLYYFLTLK